MCAAVAQFGGAGGAGGGAGGDGGGKKNDRIFDGLDPTPAPGQADDEEPAEFGSDEWRDWLHRQGVAFEFGEFRIRSYTCMYM